MKRAHPHKKSPVTSPPSDIRKTFEKEKKSVSTNIPVYSIITPVYNTLPRYFELCYESIQRQTYFNWEWCVCDDCSTNVATVAVINKLKVDKRVRVIHLNRQSGICVATKNAASLARGNILLFLDSDDELHPEAIQKIDAVFRNYDMDIVYTDEIRRNSEGVDTQYVYKPNYSPHYLLSTNYICHLVAVKKELYTEIGGIREGFDGSQDHDLILRLTAKSTKIYHIPEGLYYWRIYDGSYSQSNTVQIAADSGMRDYICKVDIKQNSKVSIVIPSIDKSSTLGKCLLSIMTKTSYPLYEIVCVGTDFSYIKRNFERDNRIKFFEHKNSLFNISYSLNYGIHRTSGQYIIVMHDDVFIESSDWIEWLIGYVQDNRVGVVGGKLYTVDNRILDMGGVIGLQGIVSSVMRGYPKDIDGYLRTSKLIHNTSVVFNSLMAFDRKKYDEVGGFDENFKVLHSDLDFSLRLRKNGYFNVVVPKCEAIHIESGRKFVKYNRQMRNSTIVADDNLFKERYADILKNGDPYYHPGLTLERNGGLPKSPNEQTTKIESIKIHQPIERPTENIEKPVEKPVDRRIPRTEVRPAKKHFQINVANNIVSFIIPWYKQVPTVIPSLLAQTYSEIEILVIHDGPYEDNVKLFIESLKDSRVSLHKTSVHTNDWGHTPRDHGIDLVCERSLAMVFSGVDNYYLPTFTQELVDPLKKNSKIAVTYCNMMHDNSNWVTINTQLKFGAIDCGCVMVRSEVAKEIRWGNKVSWEDWVFVEKVMNKYGASVFYKVPRMLYIHN